MSPDSSPERLLSLAVSLAHEAGSLLCERAQRPATGVSTKSSATDLVSDADRDSERLILGGLREQRPDDGLIGEEGGDRDTVSGITWVVDPLDATVNFLFGIPWWCVSIAAGDKEGDLLGVVHNPILGETFSAIRGEGAWLNGARISVSETSDISKALIATGFAYPSEARRVQAAVAARVLPEVRDLRRMGSAALDLCSLACGRVDGFYESHLEEWDKAAGRLLVSEAGGSLKELNPPIEGMSPGVLASNGKIHSDLERLVEGE
jgi:myo-inositol-1(or 4)-monophosphatase